MSAENQSGQLLIFAKAMNGRILRVLAKSSDTIGELKEALRQQNPRHLPQTASFRLISRAKNLTEKKTLAELQISSQQMLHLVEIEKVTISDPNSPTNEEASKQGAAGGAATRVEAPKMAAPKPVTEKPAASAPKHDSTKAQPAAAAKPALELGGSFKKVVNTASKLLPGEGERDIVRQGSMGGLRTSSSNSATAGAKVPQNSPPAAIGIGNLLQGESFHKIVRTASKILPSDTAGLSRTSSNVSSGGGAAGGTGGGPSAFKPPSANENNTTLNGVQRTLSTPLDKHTISEEAGEWSGEEEEKAKQNKRANGGSVAESDSRDEEDVFQAAMAALGSVVVVMEGVKTTVDAATTKLEGLERDVARLSAGRSDLDRLSQRVAAAEARATGSSPVKEELIRSIADRLARLERSLNGSG